MRLIWTLGFIAGTMGVCAGLPGACFDPQIPTVAFRCGEQDACPDGYECRPDGCCHKEGSPLDEHGACGDTSPDAGVPDAQVTQDASA